MNWKKILIGIAATLGLAFAARHGVDTDIRDAVCKDYRVTILPGSELQ